MSDTLQHRLTWGAAGAAALVLHLLLLLFLWQQMMRPGEPARGVAVWSAPPAPIVVLPRARPPVPRQIKDVPEPKEPTREAILPPPLTAESGRAGQGDVFCFERPAVAGVVVYDCLRLWPPEDPFLDTRLGFAPDWRDLQVFDGPVLGSQTLSREEAARRGWVRGSARGDPTRDPTSDGRDRSGADGQFDPSPSFD